MSVKSQRWIHGIYTAHTFSKACTTSLTRSLASSTPTLSRQTLHATQTLRQREQSRGSQEPLGSFEPALDPKRNHTAKREPLPPWVFQNVR